MHEIPAERVREARFDVVLFQSHRNYLEDQHAILSAEQRRGPRIFLEHNPPRKHPTDTRHPVDDPAILLVHVTAFNDLMWDNGGTPTRVIEHGVTVPSEVRYSGELVRGIVAINCITRRGRKAGSDIFARVRERVPLDLVGMEADQAGGLGEIPPPGLVAVEARYRFFFNPLRYTSLGLAVCEAMMLGMPVIGLATTEMVTAVENGVSGYVDTNVDVLVERMSELLVDAAEARRLGAWARRRALERFNIDRFVRDWNSALAEVCGPWRGIPVPADLGAFATPLPMPAPDSHPMVQS